MLRCDRRKASAEGSPIKVGNVVGGAKHKAVQFTL